MGIVLKMKEGNKEASLQIDTSSEKERMNAIGGFFKFFEGTSTVNQSISPIPVDIKVETSAKKPLKQENKVTPPTPLPEKEKAERAKAVQLEKGIMVESESIVRPKQLPLVGSSRGSGVPIGEIIGYGTKKDKSKREEEPEFYRTGIKTDEDGTKRYKCRYWCKCGEKGNHYIPLGTTEIKCHSCDNSIPLKPATLEVNKDGVPGRDDFGNFFLARVEK